MDKAGVLTAEEKRMTQTSDDPSWQESKWTMVVIKNNLHSVKHLSNY
jgi:hypothetical protein